MQFGYRKNNEQKDKRYIRYSGMAFLFLFILWSILQLNLRTQPPVCYVLDVGQGDCSIILYEHKAWMIDGGGLRNKQGDNVGVDVIIPFLASHGIHEIEGAFISHFHFDHVKGMMEVGERIPIRQVYINYHKMNFFRGKSESYVDNDGYDMLKEVKAWSTKLDIPIVGMKEGDKIVYKEMQLTCETPNAKVMDESNENNQSLILELAIYNTTMLFTGDMEAEQEALTDVHDVDILKVGHHGSSTSTTEAFLEKTHPELAVISVGTNTYGHPSKEVLDRLKEEGSVSFSTQDYGMLAITFNKKGYQLEPYK